MYGDTSASVPLLQTQENSRVSESHELRSAIPPQILGQVFRSARHQDALSVELTRAMLKPAGKV